MAETKLFQAAGQAQAVRQHERRKIPEPTTSVPKLHFKLSDSSLRLRMSKADNDLNRLDELSVVNESNSLEETVWLGYGSAAGLLDECLERCALLQRLGKFAQILFLFLTLV